MKEWINICKMRLQFLKIIKMIINIIKIHKNEII